MRQLDRQRRRLELVQTRDGRLTLADVLLAPAIHAQRPRAFGHLRVAGEDRAAVAERAEVLGRVEAERGRVAEGANTLARVLGAVRLGAILEHLEPVRSRALHDLVDGRGLSVQVHDQHRAASDRSLRRSISCGSRPWVSGSTSQNTGRAPVATSAATGGTPALATVSTSSPGWTPSACSPIRIASVPEPTPTLRTSAPW